MFIYVNVQMSLVILLLENRSKV